MALYMCAMRSILLAMLLASVASQASAAAMADMQTNPAKGTKSCLVWDPIAEVFAQVYADGGVGLTVATDTDPRQPIYFLIDGERYAGPSTDFVRVSADALRGDPLIDYSYTRWPTGAEIIEQVTITEFAGAYDQCVGFLANQ